MDLNTFDILMIIALGTLAGTIAGLAIGCAAKRQKPQWSQMTEADRRITLALILLFSVAFMAALAWYELTAPAAVV